MESEEQAKKIPRKNPRYKTNVCTRVGFCWTLPFFIKGCRKDLDEDDLYDALDEHKSNKLGNKLETEWQKELTKEDPKFWKALWRSFGMEYVFYAIIVVIIEGLKITQPLSLSKLLAYFQPGQNDVTRNEAFMYAGFIFGASFLTVSGVHTNMLNLQHLGMKMRIACCSLIYRKSLKLSKKAMNGTTIGQMVNLLSNDVNRFDRCVLHVHHLWLVPIETLVVFSLMYVYLGFTCAVGVGFLSFYLPLHMYLGRLNSMLRLKTALRTDERVRLMHEIVNGIKVIKMYTWELPFAKLVQLARKKEILYIRRTYLINGITLSLSIFSSRFTVFITIFTYVILGNIVTADYVFVLYSFFNILRQCMTIYFPHGMQQFAETKVSINRISTFLLYDEIEQIDTSISMNNFRNEVDQIKLTNVTAKWAPDLTDNTLSHITFTAKNTDLVAIIGPVGSGKSSILQLILQELPVQNGKVESTGKISYASQEAWLFGGTVRQNILFGSKYDEKRYHDVVKVCALERDYKIFPHGDKTLVGERGIMVSGGQKARINLARAIYKEADIYLLDDPLSAVDTHVGKRLFEDCIENYLSNKCVILVTHQLQYLQNLNNIILIDKGAMKAHGSYADIQGLDYDFSKLMETKEDDYQFEKKKLNSMESIHEQYQEQQRTKEARQRGNIKGSTYSEYFKACGSMVLCYLVFFSFILSQLAASGADYFLTFWVNSEQQAKAEEVINSHRYLYIYSYLAIIIAIIVIALLRSMGFFEMCMKASIRLHKRMFISILTSPMKFFHTNTHGVILNRFSKDMGSVDENLPFLFSDALQLGLNALGISVIVGIVNPIFFGISLLIFVGFYIMRRLYLSTSRDIKRLEGTTRSPVFTHINASLQGLPTIRAFNAQDALIREFDKYQDNHSSAYYMFLVISRSFGCWLDYVCVIYLGLVTFSFVFFDTETYGGNVGLAITQSLSLTGTFQWGMRQWSELENQMTSVERILEYTKLPKEKIDKVHISNAWPTNGKIEFRSVSLRYNEKDPYVLKNLCFITKSHEKIGIVGRTGAGKSSLITALFQLSKTEGDIIIDGTNITTIGLKDLRSGISIIPQEPVLFSGTMRKNLDPFEEFSDMELWAALGEVELKTVISEMPAGLNTRMMEGGSNFSVGQRQLVCLARAIIRRNRILVLDEATANVDPHTDILIQQTIRRKFEKCTVLTIAHRLNTIMDSDRVMVIDAGVIREFDAPYTLLQDEDGCFTALVNQTGRSMSENLREIAKKAMKINTLNSVVEESTEFKE